MIKSVTVTNYTGESKTMELAKPEDSGFIITNIDGLGPPAANVNVTELSTTDGAFYNSARLTSRNIVLSLRFMGEDIEAIRQLTYKYFPIKQRVTLLFELDNRYAECYGWVEKNEPKIFAEFEETQISIICPDPYFYSAGEDGTHVTLFSGIIAMFEFPFSNESLTEDLIEMSWTLNRTEQIITYEGDAEVGMIMKLHFNDVVKNIGIYNLGTGESLKINTDKITELTGTGIGDGDEIIISTERGNKYATLLRGGKYTNILNCIDRYSDWLQLRKGENKFSYSAEQGGTEIDFMIENRIIYEGV